MRFVRSDAMPAEVCRLSPNRVWFQPDPSMGLFLRQRQAQVVLHWRDRDIGPLRGEVVRGEGRSGVASIRFESVALECGRQILELLATALRQGIARPQPSALPVQQEIVSGERIRTLLAMLASLDSQGLLYRGRRAIPVRLEWVDTERNVLGWSCVDPSALGPPPYEIELVSYNSACRMNLSRAKLEGETVVTPLPDRLSRVRHRWHRRIPVEPGLMVSFEHPLWPELGSRVCEVEDISFGGLRLCSGFRDGVYPGLRLPHIEVRTPQGEVIHLSGEVRHMAIEAGACGLSVEALDEENRRRWIHLVEEQLCPSTCTSENFTESLWELFTRSGYFSLAGRSAAYFDEIKKNFESLARRSTLMPQLVCQTVWPSERGAEGTASFLKAYQYSWMGHQVARRPGKPPAGVTDPGQILRDLYLRGIEHMQSDLDFRWIVAYVEPTVPWIEKAHLRFVPQHQDSGEALSMSMRMMNAYCDEPSGQTPESSGAGLDIGPATAEELALLCETLRRTRPACYREALDLVEDRIEMKAINSAWNRFGLERERQVLVARRDGWPLAAAVLELGQLGTNLFRLLDASRIVPLDRNAKRAYVPLLDAARTWYADRGRRSFLYLREDDDWSYAEAARLHDLSEPTLWIISAQLVPEYLEYLFELIGGRRRLVGTLRRARP
ncbi:MAG TPA: hypothetical protein VH877_02455 [Polyangia bacterium]|nr:hypothetical protein [Polyangia bacterium]